jgi:hypothetical protein
VCTIQVRMQTHKERCKSASLLIKQKDKKQKNKKGKRKKKKANKCILCGVRCDCISEKEHIYFVLKHINKIN